MKKRNTLLQRKNIPLLHFIVYNINEYKYHARIYLHGKQSDTNPQIKTHEQNITYSQFYYQNITTGNNKRRKIRCLCGFPAFRRLLELQTDSTGYKQKSLILRHFQKRLKPINHYKKEK